MKSCASPPSVSIFSMVRCVWPSSFITVATVFTGNVTAHDGTRAPIKEFCQSFSPVSSVEYAIKDSHSVPLILQYPSTFLVLGFLVVEPCNFHMAGAARSFVLVTRVLHALLQYNYIYDNNT